MREIEALCKQPWSPHPGLSNWVSVSSFRLLEHAVWQENGEPWLLLRLHCELSVNHRLPAVAVVFHGEPTPKVSNKLFGWLLSAIKQISPGASREVSGAAEVRWLSPAHRVKLHALHFCSRSRPGTRSASSSPRLLGCSREEHGTHMIQQASGVCSKSQTW